ncbi:hypothetical protein [Rhodobacter capsulatus]|uniref:hypothetical protein n=1 Tax=Rhodobacter capsulatus TaxID=1061 RepID=UPI004029B30D
MTLHLSVLASYRKDGDLSLSRITTQTSAADFADLADLILNTLRSDGTKTKKQLVGFIPTRFNKTKHAEFTPWRKDYWRCKEGEVDEVYFAVFDIDNNVPAPHYTIADLQQSFPFSYAAYETFTSTPQRNKFRIVMELSRTITRNEFYKITSFMNEHVFNGQADASMSDAAHYAIAPHHGATSYQNLSLGPCDVDAMLAHCGGYERKSFDNSGVTVAPSCADTYDPVSWITDTDLDYYRTGERGHWQRLFILCVRAWKRSEGRLSYNDMLTIANHIDMSDGGYFVRTYGNTAFTKRIKEAMQTPVTQSIEWSI